MPLPPKIAIVEDNLTQRLILQRLLEPENRVVAYPDGDHFLAANDTADIELVLLDIEMPGRNGYQTCQALRERGNHVPVIFVSAHDSTPERVAAYEAGGDDFVTKPIAIHELQHKIHAVLDHRRQLAELAARSAMAQQVAFTAMTSMGDLGVVIEFLRQTTLCLDYTALADRLLDALLAWQLRGAVQIRGQRGQCNRSTEGSMSPLQISVLGNMRDMGRLFEFGSRVIVNYPAVSLLIENLPADDPDRTGRLRDHLAVLAESTDLRVQGLDAMHERDVQKAGIHEVLAGLRQTLARLAEGRRRNRTVGQVHLVEALEDLARTLNSLGLTESQRNYVEDLLKCLLDDTQHHFDEAANLDTEFADIVQQLERLANLPPGA